jgi:transcriptional regulator with XRE-family HTH domain
MSRTLRSRRHEALVALLINRREKAKLTQAQLAKKLGRYQSFVARVESGQRRIDIIELLDLAEAIGFDPREALKRLIAVRQDN